MMGRPKVNEAARMTGTRVRVEQALMVEMSGGDGSLSHWDQSKAQMLSTTNVQEVEDCHGTSIVSEENLRS